MQKVWIFTIQKTKKSILSKSKKVNQEYYNIYPMKDR